MTFWGFVVWSNVAVCVAWLVVMWYCAVRVAEKFTQLHPDFKTQKQSVAKVFSSIGLLVVIGLIPVLNFAVLLTVLGNIEEFVKSSISKIETQYDLVKESKDAQDGVV